MPNSTSIEWIHFNPYNSHEEIRTVMQVIDQLFLDMAMEEGVDEASAERNRKRDSDIKGKFVELERTLNQINSNLPISRQLSFTIYIQYFFHEALYQTFNLASGSDTAKSRLVGNSYALKFLKGFLNAQVFFETLIDENTSKSRVQIYQGLGFNTTLQALSKIYEGSIYAHQFIVGLIPSFLEKLKSDLNLSESDSLFASYISAKNSQGLVCTQIALDNGNLKTFDILSDYSIEADSLREEDHFLKDNLTSYLMQVDIDLFSRCVRKFYEYFPHSFITFHKLLDSDRNNLFLKICQQAKTELTANGFSNAYKDKLTALEKLIELKADASFCNAENKNCLYYLDHAFIAKHNLLVGCLERNPHFGFLHETVYDLQKEIEDFCKSGDPASLANYLKVDPSSSALELLMSAVETMEKEIEFHAKCKNDEKYIPALYLQYFQLFLLSDYVSPMIPRKELIDELTNRNFIVNGGSESRSPFLRYRQRSILKYFVSHNRDVDHHEKNDFDTVILKKILSKLSAEKISDCYIRKFFDCYRSLPKTFYVNKNYQAFEMLFEAHIEVKAPTNVYRKIFFYQENNPFRDAICNFDFILFQKFFNMTSKLCNIDLATLPNQKDGKCGDTLLITAAKKLNKAELLSEEQIENLVKIMQLLILRGAAIDYRNKDNKRASDYIRKKFTQTHIPELLHTRDYRDFVSFDFFNSNISYEVDIRINAANKLCTKGNREYTFLQIKKYLLSVKEILFQTMTLKNARLIYSLFLQYMFIRAIVNQIDTEKSRNSIFEWILVQQEIFFIEENELIQYYHPKVYNVSSRYNVFSAALSHKCYSTVIARLSVLFYELSFDENILRRIYFHSLEDAATKHPLLQIAMSKHFDMHSVELYNKTFKETKKLFPINSPEYEYFFTLKNCSTQLPSILECAISGPANERFTEILADADAIYGRDKFLKEFLSIRNDKGKTILWLLCNQLNYNIFKSSDVLFKIKTLLDYAPLYTHGELEEAFNSITADLSTHDADQLADIKETAFKHEIFSSRIQASSPISTNSTIAATKQEDDLMKEDNDDGTMAAAQERARLERDTDAANQQSMSEVEDAEIHGILQDYERPLTTIQLLGIDARDRQIKTSQNAQEKNIRSNPEHLNVPAIQIEHPFSADEVDQNAQLITDHAVTPDDKWMPVSPYNYAPGYFTIPTQSYTHAITPPSPHVQHFATMNAEQSKNSPQRKTGLKRKLSFTALELGDDNVFDLQGPPDKSNTNVPINSGKDKTKNPQHDQEQPPKKKIKLRKKLNLQSPAMDDHSTHNALLKTIRQPIGSHQPRQTQLIEPHLVNVPITQSNTTSKNNRSSHVNPSRKNGFANSLLSRPIVRPVVIPTPQQLSHKVKSTVTYSVRDGMSQQSYTDAKRKKAIKLDEILKGTLTVKEVNRKLVDSNSVRQAQSTATVGNSAATGKTLDPAKIGRKAENKLYARLEENLRAKLNKNKYQGFKFFKTSDLLHNPNVPVCKIKNDAGDCVELYYNNYSHRKDLTKDSVARFDLYKLTTVNGEVVQTKFIECKGTTKPFVKPTSDKRVVNTLYASFTDNELTLIKALKDEQKNSSHKYRLWGGFGIGSKDIHFEKLKNPYYEIKAGRRSVQTNLNFATTSDNAVNPSLKRK